MHYSCCTLIACMHACAEGQRNAPDAYVCFQTGEGLPPGPYGVYGALEGVSYLVVLFLISWSVTKKLRTGVGLPSGVSASTKLCTYACRANVPMMCAGPGGLLGGVEGLSFLSLVAAVLVFGSELITKGSLPGPTGR